MWQRFLADYFSFTKKERKGIIYATLIILFFILYSIFSRFLIKDNPVDHTQFEKEITQLRLDSSAKKSYTKNYENEYYNDYTPAKFERTKKAELFLFDPNTATVNDWIRLGIKQHTAETIQKYISKGGKFYRPDDIKKIWGLSKTNIDRLLPYVSIKAPAKEYQPFVKKEQPENSYSYTSHTIQKVDINLADTGAYIALPGIGSRLAQRIISFREKLGGFYSIDQIGETYLLPDSTFKKIKSHLVLQSKAIKKININVASIEEMKLHPYIRYNIANAIFQYRQQHGNFSSIEDIKKIMVVTEDKYAKAAPYLTVE